MNRFYHQAKNAARGRIREAAIGGQQQSVMLGRLTWKVIGRSSKAYSHA